MEKLMQLEKQDFVKIGVCVLAVVMRLCAVSSLREYFEDKDAQTTGRYVVLLLVDLGTSGLSGLAVVWALRDYLTEYLFNGKSARALPETAEAWVVDEPEPEESSSGLQRPAFVGPGPSVPERYKDMIEAKMAEYSTFFATPPAKAVQDAESGWHEHSTFKGFTIYTKAISPERTSKIRMVGNVEGPLRRTMASLAFLHSHEESQINKTMKQLIPDLDKVVKVEQLNDQTDIIHIIMKKIMFIAGRDMVVLRHWRAQDDGSVLTVEMPLELEAIPEKENYIRAIMNSSYYLKEAKSRGQTITIMDRVFDLDIKLGEVPAFVVKAVDDFNVKALKTFPDTIKKIGGKLPSDYSKTLRNSPAANFKDMVAPAELLADFKTAPEEIEEIGLPTHSQTGGGVRKSQSVCTLLSCGRYLEPN